MKVLHLIDEPWDSGLTAYAIQIALLQKQARMDVTLGVRPGKKPEALARESGLLTTPIASLLDLKRTLAHYPVDLINAHTGTTHTWAVVAKGLFLKGAQKNIPIVRTRGDARALKVNFLSRFIYRRTAAVICASDHIRKQYEVGFGLSEERARTIYPSVEIDESVMMPPLRVVGILGRLDPVKGHTLFLEAAARVLQVMPGVQFLVGGKEANVSVALLKNHARQLGIQGAVQFLGYQPSAQEFMRRCTVGVIASLGSEEVSRVCLEWMGVGRPVVGTLVGCLPELIEVGETGLLVPPGDSVAMGEALLRVLKGADEARRWGIQAYRVAAARFSGKTQLEKTNRIYGWAMDRTVPRAQG